VRTPSARTCAAEAPATGRSTGFPADLEADLAADHPVEVDVVIEVPRFSFLKRGWGGGIDFVSPLPCPYNYGAVPTHLGLEGDLLDALVLGPRLPLGARLRLPAWGAVTLTDRGLSDDKLICSAHRPSAAEIARVLRFFRFYARCKGLLNLLRRRPGRNSCDGLRTAEDALARAQTLAHPPDRAWGRPPVPF
jgi:inorganic pyrophosphatase